jgi:hypothetical protein
MTRMDRMHFRKSSRQYFSTGRCCAYRLRLR